MYVHGYVEDAGAYLVKDLADGDMLLVPGSAFVDGAPPPKTPLSTDDRPRFAYRVHSEVYVAPYADDPDDVKAATILHHALDAGQRYYVVVRPDDFNSCGCCMWWAAFDVCREDQLSLK